VRFLADDERRALLAETAKDAVLHTFVMIALSTACRAGELQKLEWSDVDVKAGRLLFRETKNGQARSAWVSGSALELLKEHGKVRKIKGGPLFEHSKRNNLYDYSKPFRAAVKASGIAHLRFHDLRHTAATYLAQAGATEQQLRAIGGWKSGIVSRYVHVAAADAKVALEKLADRSCPTAWCTSRESWFGRTRAQLTTADNRAV
jgi:integrase